MIQPQERSQPALIALVGEDAAKLYAQIRVWLTAAWPVGLIAVGTFAFVPVPIVVGIFFPAVCLMELRVIFLTETANRHASTYLSTQLSYRIHLPRNSWLLPTSANSLDLWVNNQIAQAEKNRKRDFELVQKLGPQNAANKVLGIELSEISASRFLVIVFAVTGMFLPGIVGVLPTNNLINGTYLFFVFFILGSALAIFLATRLYREETKERLKSEIAEELSSGNFSQATS